MHKASEEIVLPDGLGLNQCSNNQSKTPSPDPGSGFPMCFQGGFGDFYFSTIYIVARNAIQRNSMRKLIWSLAEAKLRIMRAAEDTHSSAFPWLGKNMKDLEGLERRPDQAGPKGFPFFFSPAKKSQQRSVRGTHAFPLLAAVLRQQKKFNTRIFGSSWTRQIDVICKIEI